MTILSARRRFAFVHVHKRGGTSIERAYARHAKLGPLGRGPTHLAQFQEMNRDACERFGYDAQVPVARGLAPTGRTWQT